MDLNFNNSNKRRKVQTVQDMLASPVQGQPGRQPGPSQAQPVMQQSLRQSAESQPIKRQQATGQGPLGQQGIRVNSARQPVDPGAARPSRAQQPGANVKVNTNVNVNGAAAERSFGIDFREPVSFVYFGILLVCVVSTVIINALSGGGPASSSAVSGKTAKKLYAARDTINTIPTVMGLIPELLDNFVAGGSSSENKTLEESEMTTPDGSSISQEVSDDGTITTTNQPDSAAAVTQAGAAMVLDGGQGLSGYTEAASHTELVTQLESALASGDYTFVGMKLAYKDDYGDLKGYPQTVVSYFTEYMAANSEKRTAFISQISSESYSAMNDSAYLVVLPVIQFTVNMAYDNTTVSVPGFGDTIVNSGQSVVIKPLLPCMYSVTLSNAMWSAPVTKEIATSLDELSYSLSVS